MSLIKDIWDTLKASYNVDTRISILEKRTEELKQQLDNIIKNPPSKMKCPKCKQYDIRITSYHAGGKMVSIKCFNEACNFITSVKNGPDLLK